MISHCGVPRPVDSVLLHLPDHVGREAPGHRYSVDSGHERSDPLPLRDPAFFGGHQADESVEIGTSAIVQVTSVLLQVQKLLAVVAPVPFELPERLHQRAPQAGTASS